MSQENEKQNALETSIQQQISMLNLRINDMMTQLNTTLKALVEDNQAIKKENTTLKQQTPKP